MHYVNVMHIFLMSNGLNESYKLNCFEFIRNFNCTLINSSLLIFRNLHNKLWLWGKYPKAFSVKDFRRNVTRFNKNLITCERSFSWTELLQTWRLFLSCPSSKRKLSCDPYYSPLGDIFSRCHLVKEHKESNYEGRRGLD